MFLKLLIVLYLINMFKNFIKYKYKPKKVQSQLTNMIVFDLETFNTDRAVPYANCIYRLGKISGKYDRDITQRENKKCRKVCIVFNGTDSNNEMIDYVLQFKGEAKRNNSKIVKYNLYLLAHKGSGFDSYVVSNNLPHWRTVVSLNKYGSGIVSLKTFNGYVEQAKKTPDMFILDAVYCILKIL